MEQLPPLGLDPIVTVVIPCLNEKHHVDRCVQDVMAQDYPPHLLEVIIADGGSTDGTRERLDSLSGDNPRMRWIDNPGKLQSAGLNAAIRVARGDIIIRLDAHCECARDYVRQSVMVLRETGAWNAGGSQRGKPQNPFQHAFCAALRSRLAMGGAAYRHPGAEGFVDTVFCGAFRREVFELAGAFDPAAITNEDAELNQRILECGGHIYLSPRIITHYYPRRDILEVARQYFRYGQRRARTLLKRGRFPRITPAIPFLATCVGALLVATKPFAPVTWLVFGIYAVICLVEAVRVALPIGLRAIPMVWAVFPTIHVSHGIGFAAGLIRYLLRPDWSRTPEYLPERLAIAATGVTEE